MNGIHDAAYQGAAGAFSEEAARRLLGPSASLLACERFEDVFDALDAGRVALAVVPVENTLAGAVRAVRDLLDARRVTVAGELSLRISHALVACPGATVETVRRVRSHPVALAQCKSLFHKNPRFEAVADYDTAGAVERVVRAGALDEAAIAARRAADVYGGVVLAEDVQDSTENFTRFLAVRYPFK